MSADFTNEQPFEVTPEVLASFKRVRSEHKLACGLCHARPMIGDVIRWIHIPSGAPNTFVCEPCDRGHEASGLDIKQVFKAYYESTVRPILRRWGST